ncbi:MAG TPA: 16S rRNA (guanine(966)-N(2))-methyltransferase RsmD [Candidatus Limnocylindrales bacterium]|nr:16S rRNA (guanine(966)-N(2))-methyltransferase RsmD [Candidatus Limnocylindrales bacterium]
MADAGRVIAGTARGIRLAAPGTGTRPLTDRVKQTLFAMLEPELADAVVVDLYAGSGAGAIEALSRGAARAILVEKDAGACRVIAENLRRTRLEADARVVRRDVIAWLAEPAGATAEAPFDLVLLDPPYADTAGLARALELVAPHLRDGGIVVAKHFWRDAPPARVGMLASERERRFGETALTFYRRTDEEAGEA